MYPVRIGCQFLHSGYDVYGLCLKDTSLHTLMSQSGIPTYSVEHKNQLLLSELFKLIRWVKQRKITVIHCHKSGDLVIARLISCFCSVRVVFTEHMGSTRSKKDLYHRWAYRCVDQVLSISDATYSRNIKALPVHESKISRLWLGTDIPNEIISDQRVIDQIKQEYNIPTTHKVIGTVGRISQGKGQIELLQAFSVIHQKYPQTSLVIVGGTHKHEGCDPDYLQRLKQVIREHRLENDVYLTGFLKDVQRMLATMDVVCLPYKNEAFGLTAIEAMAAQKPIVAADTGALPEIFGDTALLCNPLDSTDIARMLGKVFEEEDVAITLAREARKRAITEFSMETHIQKLFLFYTAQSVG